MPNDETVENKAIDIPSSKSVQGLDEKEYRDEEREVMKYICPKDDAMSR